MSTTSSGYSRRGASSLLAPPAPPSSTQSITQPIKFTASPDTVVKPSPFLADFVDCIENLPNRLQLLLSELRNIDLLIKTRHRGIQLVKEEITRRATSDDHAVTDSNQLLKQLHQLLIECQQLADQKIKLTTQIIETISHKARQLGFDHKSNEVKQIPKELNEESILADFRLAIKKTRSVPHLHHHYSGSSSSNLNNINNRTSSRNINNHNNIGPGGSSNSQQLINSASKSKLAYDINNNNKSGLKSSLNLNGNVGKGQTNCRAGNNGNDSSINSMNKSLRNMITSGSGNKKKNHSPVELNKRSIKKMKLDNSSTTTASGIDSAQTRSKRQLNYTATGVKSNQPAHQSKSIHVIGSTLAKKRRLNSLSTGVKSPSSTLSSSSTMSSSFRIKQQQLKRSLNNNSNLVAATKGKRQSKNSRKKANEETATSDDDGNHNDDGENQADDYEIGNTSDENIKINPRNYDDEDAIQNVSDADDDELFKSTAAGSTSRRSTRTRATASVDQRRKQNQRNRRSDDSDTDREENPNDELNSNETESINNIDEDDENQNNDEDENNAEDIKQASEIKSSTRSSRKETNAKTGGRNKGGTATTTAGTAADTVSHSTSRISNNNSDEPVYCSCREVSYGQMICCDNDGCSIEWFHFQCVKLTVKPKGKWYCPDCRGETHRVMKKPHLLNNNNNTNLANTQSASSSSAVPTTSSSPSTSSYYSKQK